MKYDNTCFIKETPPQPEPGKGCKSYYQELRCFKPLHPDPFVYNLIFKISNIAFNDIPHLEFVISEIDKLDLALRNAKNLDKISLSKILPSFTQEEKPKSKDIVLRAEAKDQFPESCKVIIPPVVIYKFNKLKLYLKFSQACKSDMVSFLGDKSKSGNFVGMKLLFSLPYQGDLGHMKLAPTV